jgi:hypothetical protein
MGLNPADAQAQAAGEFEGADEPLQPAMVALPSRAIMDDIHNVAGRVERHAKASPYRQTGFVPGQIETKEPAVGKDIDDELGFPVHSVVIDNPTTQWIWIESAAGFCPPNTIGKVLQVPRASTKAQVRWRPPAGVAQPAAGAGAKNATIVFCEAFLMPNPGVYLTVYPPPALV